MMSFLHMLLDVCTLYYINFLYFYNFSIIILLYNAPLFLISGIRPVQKSLRFITVSPCTCSCIHVHYLKHYIVTCSYFHPQLESRSWPIKLSCLTLWLAYTLFDPLRLIFCLKCYILKFNFTDDSQEILNAWPIILMFSGSKVGIKGIASTNSQQYCDEKILQTIFNTSCITIILQL